MGDNNPKDVPMNNLGNNHGDIEVHAPSGVAGYCSYCFCQDWDDNPPCEDRSNSNAALDARLRYLEIELFGVYPEEDEYNPKTWFKNERKLFGYIPIMRTVTLYGVISCLWGALDFSLSMCTAGIKAVTTLSIVLCGAYCLWALFYDRVVEIPPTYTYMHRRTEMYRWCGFAILVPIWYAYTATLILIVALCATLGYALAYVDYSDLFEYTCDSWLKYIGN